jgi:di/tricarboxylate transporter
MNVKVIPLILLILFVAYTGYTMSIAEQSLLSFGYQLVSSPDTAQVVIDLYIMALLALAWMYQDIKNRGKTIKHWLPYVLVTLVFVSVGPLLYLVLRPSNSEKI